MIIWSRWGILVFVFVGLSVGLGFGLKALIAPDADTNGPTTNVVIGVAFLIGAAGLWAFAKYVLPKMDKPTPAVIYEKLPEPVVNERGVKMTHRPVPVVNQETGEQVWNRPSSTFFFIPVRFWPYVLGAIGVFNVIVGIVGG